MARINIEECWWSDPRRDLLRDLLGTRTQDQVAIRAWRLAQEFWAKGKLIPWNTFKTLEGAQSLLETGLAEIRASEDPLSESLPIGTEQDPNANRTLFIYVRGSSEYLSWISEQRKKASEAGRKSAEARRKKGGSAQPKGGKGSKKTERQPNANRTEGNGTEPSVSGSGSFSGSDSDSGSAEFFAGAIADSPTPSGKSATAKTWEAYKHAFEKRYGEAPPWNAKTAGQLRALVGRISAAEAPLVAEFYLTHNAYRYVSAVHPVGLLLMDAEKLRTEWATGNRMLGSKAKEIERTQHNFDAWDNAARALDEHRRGAK
jgi:hypothetical protein